MNNTPESNRKFQSFGNQIREAQSYEEVTHIMESLDPNQIEDRLRVLAKKRGRKIETKTVSFWDDIKGPGNLEVYTYNDDNFTVVAHSMGVKLYRNGFGTIFKKKDGVIEELKTLPLWRSMNFIEELIENGDIRI